MTKIIRSQTNQRMSQSVKHGEVVYLAGQVGKPGESVADQTRTCLANVDALLAEAGTDNTRILQTTIWMADMADFAEMNEVWDAWVPEGHAPARACGEAKLATPEYKVEVLVIAACDGPQASGR
ncbi:RidA family protein [Pseudohalocynthiibacter aestuariivivens]|uniref:RidA family protein n=1 Tax=Roseovarius pelagicus TaxID=2980108 RepID=A0ABY6DEP1_9RHOB|nr:MULTISPECIES: RidA family protein [Rhodobacterales]QIE46904.1 RidA family protein [Pseudohalocynthiibacter aestuariivivens]UXX84550.1 RidA family protein [Roseovarius pelagicus]